MEEGWTAFLPPAPCRFKSLSMAKYSLLLWVCKTDSDQKRTYEELV